MAGFFSSLAPSKALSNSFWRPTGIQSCSSPAPWLSFDTLRWDAIFLSHSAGIMKELSAALTGLTTLTAHTIDIEDMDEFLCLLCLVKSSPCLRRLNITLMMEATDAPPKIDFDLEVEKQTDCCFDELTHMNVSFMTGAAAELKFIGLILAHSPSLKQLSINWHEGIDAVSELNICRELLRLRRASPSAKIVFLKPSEYADELYTELDD